MKYSILAILNRAIKENRKILNVPFNAFNLIIVKVLYEEGYLFNYYILYNKIIVEFNIKQGIFICNGFKIYKKSYRNKYISCKLLKNMMKKKNKRYLLSTTNGICMSTRALQLNTGGIVLAELK